jgi:hypothetical protein
MKPKMNIQLSKINKNNLLIQLGLFSILAACSLLPGTLEVGIEPELEHQTEITVMEELRPVLNAILYGGVQERKELVSFSNAACTNSDGLGGPPKCDPGEPEGTIVEVLPVLAGEGSFSRPESVEEALDFVVMELYAVYRVPDDAFQADYWPAGEYGLLFSREINAVPIPVTVFTEDGRIVRLQHLQGIDPEEVINQLPVESILVTPKAAQEWMAENAPQEPDIPELDFGSITGSVCFPSESIPEMTLYFQEVNRADLIYQNHPQNQSSYTISGISPGSYIAFAYPLNSGDRAIGGSYSQAVDCGLGAECTNHSPVVFDVKPGEEVNGVDICDWYSPGDVPANPELDQGFSEPQPTGSISGRICYPGQSIPEMTVFFQEISTQQITELPIEGNQTSYAYMLNPGKYVAYAYLNSGASLGGSYSNAVLCGLSVDCSDHSLIEFDVVPGETLDNIDICDWYAPETMPPDPRAELAPLASMIYSTQEGDYYLIEPNGNSSLIFSGSGLVVGGPYGVYAENNDLHAIDLFTGERYQLTFTPELRETSYHFEVGLQELLFSALPVDEEIGPGYTGGLYIIDMDGTNQRTIDSEHNAANFTASNDGQMIAYGAGETAFLYNWETGSEVFDPRDYGLDSPKGQAITSPSWSPAIDQLAWFVYGFFEGGNTQGIGIFDMFNMTFRLIHPYQALGADVTPPPVRWSPDGEWLAFSVFDQEPARSGVWLVNQLNPQQEFFMGTGSSNPVFGRWDKENKILTYSRIDETQGANKTWLFDLETGEHQLLPLPDNAQVIVW